MSHASDMGCAMQCAPGCVAIAHQYAAVVAEKGLRVDLTAARLIIEKHDRLVTVLAASISPHIGRADGLLVLFLKDLNCRLIAMNKRLRSKPQLQSVVETMQMLLA